MSDELKQLIEEKKMLERKIKALTSGTIENELAKIDRIGFAGHYQKGKWALFYKYRFIVSSGSQEIPKPRGKWVPLFNADTFDDIVNKIPEAIKALTELYETARGDGNGTDT